MQKVYVVFDGPPSHESGRFVELETFDRRGVGGVQWTERDDGFWTLGPLLKCSQEDVFKVHKALALYRSMVLGGEQESETSSAMFKEAMDVLNRIGG